MWCRYSLALRVLDLVIRVRLDTGSVSDDALDAGRARFVPARSLPFPSGSSACSLSRVRRVAVVVVVVAVRRVAAAVVVVVALAFDDVRVAAVPLRFVLGAALVVPAFVARLGCWSPVSPAGRVRLRSAGSDEAGLDEGKLAPVPDFRVGWFDFRTAAAVDVPAEGRSSGG